jgi:uncharacterized membrane protein
MNESIRGIFALVCAQNAAHTWAPGGELQPLCQRCTGFYTGSAIALLLLIWFLPKPDTRFRWAHAALVLAMTPFGFHLVPQGELLRTASGFWFGFGVVGLLWLLPGQWFSKTLHPGIGFRHLYWGTPFLLLLPVLAARGGRTAGRILPWIALAGLVGLAGLVLADIVIICFWLFSVPRRAREG